MHNHEPRAKALGNYNFVHILSMQIFVPFLDGFYPLRDVGSTPELHILNVVSQESSIVVK